MQRRHFLVQESEGDYTLRELDSTIANGIRIFGTITGQCVSVEAEHCSYYFMNSQMSEERADEIAQKLTQDFLAGNR